MITLYQRRCAIHRPRAVGGTPEAPIFGKVEYSGREETTAPGPNGEDVIFEDIPCSIQAKPTGRTQGGTGGLPADSPGPLHWQVHIPSGQVAKGAIRIRDIIVDEFGHRYQVSSDYWHMLGYSLDTVRLEI